MYGYRWLDKVLARALPLTLVQLPDELVLGVLGRLGADDMGAPSLACTHLRGLARTLLERWRVVGDLHLEIVGDDPYTSTFVVRYQGFHVVAWAWGLLPHWFGFDWSQWHLPLPAGGVDRADFGDFVATRLGEIRSIREVDVPGEEAVVRVVACEHGVVALHSDGRVRQCVASFRGPMRPQTPLMCLSTWHSEREPVHSVEACLLYNSWGCPEVD